MTHNQILSSGKVIISKSNSNIPLYKHQEQAIKALNGISSVDKYKGILVIPTGGGKTFTSVYWVMKEIINNNKKVLWLAHRHELLNQTIDTVIKKASFKNIVSERKSFTYRVISGMDEHDRPVNIEETDDFIIASKDSLNRGKEYLEKWVRANKDNICIIIDEAHHAVARTYRSIINLVEDYSENWIRVLGLTATPTRTSEKEKGLLREVFPDDICYSVDLNTLIAEGILSKPIMVEKYTNTGIRKELTTKELEYIRRTGILPENIAKEITLNKERNNFIVSEYIKNKQRYGQTLVFAVNIDHAIALNALFKEKGIKSDFVVSSLKDINTGITISTEENAAKIKLFRQEGLEVLINVNILTEGTDMPGVQTVFLARPTTSTILLNQMIGRGLRGVKAGGTAEAYLVSFIDDWKYKINWVSPRNLEIGDTDGVGPYSSGRIYEQHLINIKLIEDFAIYMDKTVEVKEKDKYREYKVIGAYIFDNIYDTNEEEEEKECIIIVFDHLKYAYEEFIDGLRDIFKKFGNSIEGIEEDIDNIIPYVKKKYFEGYDLSIGYKDEDIKEIIYHYNLTERAPGFTEIVVSEEDIIKVPIEGPTVIVPPLDYERMSMHQIRAIDPEYWRELRDLVFKKHLNEEGYYVSATGLYKNVSRRNFQIDHIVPMAKGGRTTLDNLQLLTRWENLIKGTKAQEEFMKEIQNYDYSNSKDISNIETLEEILCNAFDNDESFDKARALVKRILSEDENNIVALNIQGRLAFIDGKYRSALINANKVLAKNRVDEFALWTKGVTYYEKENYKEAIKFLELYNKLDTCFESNNLLGECYLQLKKRDIALGYFDKALHIDFHDEKVLSELHFNMAGIFFNKRKYENAFNHYTEAFNLDSSNAFAINNAGVCLERQGKLKEALENYKIAYKLNSGEVLFKNNIDKIKERLKS